MYQAGTLSGNPLAVTAGLWSLAGLNATLYRMLERLTKRLADGLLDAAGQARLPLQVNRVGSMITPFFTATPVTDYATATSSDTARFGRFHQAMLARGFYLPASQYEAWFLSSAHTERHVDRTIAAAREAFAELAG
jgi:glutamate-1-semialdehyde 2,1-aminomutase